MLANPQPVRVCYKGPIIGDRRKIRRIRNDPMRYWLTVATDAAGEGSTCKITNLMVNYDFAIGINRLEQRFVHSPYWSNRSLSFYGIS